MTPAKLERLEARVRLIDLARAARIPIAAMSRLETGAQVFSERLTRQRSEALKRLRISDGDSG